MGRNAPLRSSLLGSADFVRNAPLRSSLLGSALEPLKEQVAGLDGPVLAQSLSLGAIPSVPSHTVSHHLPLSTASTDVWSIWYAAEKGKAKRMALILGRERTVVDEEKGGVTALHIASRGGHANVVEV